MMEIAFFPYVQVKEDVELANFVLWPFSKRVNKYVSDPQTKEYLKRYFGRYFDYYNDKLLQTITILSPKTIKSSWTSQFNESR